MTSDYYVNLANYYTNQLSIGTGVESITLNENDINLDFDGFFNGILGGVYASYSITGYLTWKGSNNLIIYGELKDSNGDFVNEYIIRMIYNNGTYDFAHSYFTTTYAGGTALPRFLELKVDNDGSIYGMAGTDDGLGNASYSLIMLGNPFVTGGIKYRQSYAIPNTYTTYVNYQQLIKKENTGEYLIILNNGSNSTLILHLTINVGIPSDWEAVTYGSSVKVYDYYIAWVNSISLYLLTTGSNSNYLYLLYFNGISISQVNSIQKGYNATTNVACIYDADTVYYLVSYLDSGNAINTLYKGKFSTGNSEVVKTSSIAYSTLSPTQLQLAMVKRQQIQIIEGIVYFSYYISTGNNYGNDLFGVIANGNLYTLTSHLSIAYTDYVYFFVLNSYNIHKILMPLMSYLDIVEFQYDPNGFNGTPYIDTNMFVPYRMELYDNDSPAVLLFDRGLYNLKTYGNVTEATFNVPYTMLNSETIYQSILYGETNYSLVDENINITKNIYENLMINFFNSIVVKDYTNRIYNSGGDRVNDSISQTNDMTNASAKKIKLFNNDNTTYTYSLPTPTITGVGNPMTITYEIPLNVASDGYVLKYQILSNDENTLYFEYDTSSLNAGTYKITQECSVE